jgi:hypothetical protein
MENCRKKTLIIMIKLLNVQMGLLKMEKKTGEIRLQRKWGEKYKVENTMMLK